MSVLRNQEFPSGPESMWIVVALIFPLAGPLVYFGVRSDW